MHPQTQPDIQSMLMTAIISSSLITAVIVSLLSWFTTSYFKKVDFKNEYYKIVIKKRVEAYEAVEKAAAHLTFTMRVATARDIKIHSIFYTPESLEEFEKALDHAMTFNLWLSHSTKQTLREINRITIIDKGLAIRNELSADIQNQELLAGALRKYGYSRFDELSVLTDNIRSNIFKDLKYLHIVDWDITKIYNK